MSDYNNIIDIDYLIAKVSNYIDNELQIESIKNAYEFSKEIHEGEKRLDGNNFINHPLNVALILTNIEADYKTLIAALLHEVLNDKKTNIEELKKEFGEEIANLVNGITKINNLSFSTESEYTSNYYRKILVGLCEDVRVIFIKLSDRLHNMRTLWAVSEEKQKIKAKETLEILVPIAHRLGLYYFQSELENLSLKYYKPDIYNFILKTLNNTKIERDSAINKMKEEISDLLNKNDIKHEIKGRSKSIYSIYQKMQKGRKFNEIYDILALRVFVNKKQQCYLALGLIHSKFKPVPKRFKDYIAMPKENMYQSLHTTVFGLDGNLFEIQIRTYEMNQIAEYGIASHWSYKENINASKQFKNVMEQKLQMFRSLLELNNEELDREKFINNMKSEVFNDDLYVFTPAGDVIELPVGSTPIDFAYRVHSEIGEKMIGAIVNDNIVPLDYNLKDGDIVKINTSKNSKGPNREWLNIAKTAQAKNKIKSFFSKIDKDNYIKDGEEKLQKELKKRDISHNEFFTDENIDLILEKLNVISIEDIFYVIGNSNYTPSHIVNLIYEEKKTKEKIALDKLILHSDNINDNKNEVLIEGLDDIKVTLASCCTPIKGDKILGYITRGKGITIHRIECDNIANIDERIIDVSWNENVEKNYTTNIIIEATYKDNLLLDILSKTINSAVSIQKVNTINNNNSILYELMVSTPNVEKLKKFMDDVYKIPNIYKVERIIK